MGTLANILGDSNLKLSKSAALWAGTFYRQRDMQKDKGRERKKDRQTDRDREWKTGRQKTRRKTKE